MHVVFAVLADEAGRAAASFTSSHSSLSANSSVCRSCPSWARFRPRSVIFSAFYERIRCAVSCAAVGFFLLTISSSHVGHPLVHPCSRKSQLSNVDSSAVRLGHHRMIPAHSLHVHSRVTWDFWNCARTSSAHACSAPRSAWKEV